mgnify:CR=1 FL=1
MAHTDLNLSERRTIEDMLNADTCTRDSSGDQQVCFDDLSLQKARGRRSNNRIASAVVKFAVTLVRENYIDFGPTFAAEKLAEDHGRKAQSRTQTDALEGGCPANATSGNAQITI